MSVGAGRPMSLTKLIAKSGYSTYVAIYEVIVTDPYEDMDAVTLASGIPGYGETLSFGATVNPDCFCIEKNASYTDLDGTNLKRVVTCTFSNEPGSRARSTGNVIVNPINEPWKASGSFVLGTRPTNIDKDGAPIYTKGLEPHYLEVPDAYDTWQVEGPSPTMSLTQRKQAIGRCNSVAIWGLSLREVYLAQWHVAPLFHGDTSYFYHRMEWWIKDGGWDETWTNQGTQEYNTDYPVGQRIRAIPRDTGRTIPYLESGGKQIVDETTLPGAINNITSKVIKEFDFTLLCSSIGLPDPLPGNFV